MKTKAQKIEVTKNQLLDILIQVEKGTTVNAKIVTEARMNKGGRQHSNEYFGRVAKETHGNFMCGNSYDERVRNEMKKAGLNPDDWQPEPCKVGEHVSKCVLFNENTGSNYFQFEYHEETHPKRTFIVDGEKLDLSNGIDNAIFQNFEQYLIKHTAPKKQLLAGIDDYVILFSPKIENIKEITLNKIRYVQVEE